MKAVFDRLKTIWLTLPGPVRGLIRTMRPKQWTKNGFVFAGLLFDQQLFEPEPFARVVLAFVLLCMVASTIYLVNDLVDIERDRLHPKKRQRALPSGQLPVRWAQVAAVILPVVALAIGVVFSPPLALILLAYLALHIAYSFWLKNIVLIDVFAIAAGFVLRLIAGVVVIHVTNFSPWLYACAGLLALFLAVGKRRQELILLAEDAQNVRATYRDYNMALLDDMLRLVTTSCTVAYMLYTIEAQTIRSEDHWMLLTVPFVVYGIFRYLYLIHVKGLGGAPDELLFKDMPLLADVTLWVVAVGILLYAA
ncbi:decaprenyl-phosphate phosphoribosyltransferase [Aggregatilinea lenta]|uniref:decaprenyl-phosphate phosphoribosyltransferase n=1 Tax=Aggregatilinea lenta TaxID=913108 RepID=UPI001EE8236E|nr:decaprenyl-phosphate phosphoribosyltransferase [Aggregatilinea lenta]